MIPLIRAFRDAREQQKGVDVEKEALNMLKHPRTAGPPYSFGEGGMRAPTSVNDRVGGRTLHAHLKSSICGVDTNNGRSAASV
jgi:hypothetical protein